ncbi:MAG: CDP-alcohol phosphatidyltransferase [Prevotellaceae bacterium]|jgi:phosphatidylglycerophosphate synthase|nr:CDP-alcohol phosphatidyltransferase [Prevotellaceae bacterium]
MQASDDTISKIQKDRQRTNLFRRHEQALIAFLVERMPNWISSNNLTAIGFVGSIITAGSFVLAAYINKYLLLLGLFGLLLNWFGDSLDGRLAYYRNKPRKWYGFSLDFSVDWLTIILISFGFIIYAEGQLKFLGFGFAVFYAWAMITALLRYKLTGKYTIDSGLFGPTEVRVIIGAVLVLECLFHNSILYSAALVCVFLLVVNIIDFRKLLCIADEKDKSERENAQS